ncbi:MAG TPA: LLM class flavin-dependent oxidoreductase [Candidatus Acidoferrum sp.]|nr:LLM class flavin-dependent oxidoreductase [Candidatus Acidoferrum sp.]
MAQSSRLASTPLSILDLAHLRQGGTVSEAFHNSLALAQHAETLGYKRFWLAEHHNIQGVACSATSVLISYVANGTSRIRVGAGGIMLPNHAPLVIAEQFGTLESLFPGRIDLGLGRAPGGDSAAMRALRSSLRSGGDDFPEQVEELRRYLGERAASQRVHAYPGEGTNVPIYLLGSSDFSARLAGELGLPFAFAAHFQPQPLLPALHIYRSTFRPSEVLQKPYTMVGVPILVADSDERAQFLATTAVQMFLNLIRGVPGPLPPPVKTIEWTADEREMVAAKFGAAIVGGPERVAARLSRFLDETQADELIVVANTYDFEDRLRSYELLANLTKHAEETTQSAAIVVSSE